MDAKKELRSRMLARRNSMESAEVREKSDAIFSRLCTLPHYEKAKVVLAYMDYRNEVKTAGFIKGCLRDGKRVALPKVEPGAGVFLSLYEIKDPEEDTCSGFKGIPEPDAAKLKKLEPGEIDLAVIPGVVFDRRRNRIGYGAGYYDRLLPELRSDCLKAGVAYGIQVVDKISTGAYDIPVDVVVTEDEQI